MEAKFIIPQLSPLPEEVKTEHNIIELPSPLYIDDTEYTDNDVPFPLEDMCRILLDDIKKVGSAQSTPQDYINIIQGIPEDVPVFMICLSSKLSGYYTSALEAKEKCSNRDITVIDTRYTPPVLSLYALKASEIAKTVSSADELREKVLGIKDRIGQYWAFHSLKYLYKAGRINAAQAFLGKMIHLVPIITADDDGTLITVVKVRRIRKAFSTIADLIKTDMEKQGASSLDIIVLHTAMAEENGRLLEEKLKDELPVKQSMLLRASYVTHRMVGPDAVSAAFCFNT